MTELTDQELDRYSRQLILPQVGGVGQRKLKTARVAIIGAGGIGCSVIPALAGAGVGRLTIIDDDAVKLTNLNRQSLFREIDEGRSKAELAADTVLMLNESIDAVSMRVRVDARNAANILSGHDLVIDGSDNFATRLAVSDACVALGTPLLSAAAVQFQGQVALFRARPCYRCFVGDAFDADDCDTCAEQGVLGALTATAGSFAALMAIRAIVGIGDDAAGKLHLFDGVSLAWRTMRIPADPACKACAQPSA